MANVKLTPTQLAALDLMIAAKREDALFITDVANDVGHVANAVVAVTAAATAVAAVVAGAREFTPTAGAATPGGVTLDRLIKIREEAS